MAQNRVQKKTSPHATEIATMAKKSVSAMISLKATVVNALIFVQLGVVRLDINFLGNM